MRNTLIALSFAAMVLLAVGAILVQVQPDAPMASSSSATSGILQGICEASALLATADGFLVGDNESDEALHPYDAAFTALPTIELPVEVEDIEALVRTPQGLMVVGSQSRNKKGKRKPDREQILNLDSGISIKPDLSACVPCMAAGDRAPKEGGLSIEGAAWWNHAVWLGLRSPLDGKDALLLELTEDGAIARQIRVALDGYGVRELAVVDGTLFVLAGPVTGGDDLHALYSLASPEETVEHVRSDLPAHSEGFVIEPDGAVVVVIDGDGKPGKPCDEPARWERLAPTAATSRSGPAR